MLTEPRMIIPEVAPMLTCVSTADGFLFELVVKADADLPPITKVRIGPYRFKPEYQPRKGLFGMSAGGPEAAFWMHKRTPRGWSRLNWEVDESQDDKPAYLVSSGVLRPGQQGLYQFVSAFPPGGLRVGLEVYRGDDHKDYGVSGPNYEHFTSEEFD